MAIIVISYDVDNNQQAAAKNMLMGSLYNYSSVIKIDGIDFDLPNTTLCKQGTTVAQAKVDMENVARSLKAKITKGVALEVTAAEGI